VRKDSNLKILAEAETLGHSGVSLRMIRDPKRERLLVARGVEGEISLEAVLNSKQR
jgi:hypothetical protein